MALLEIIKQIEEQRFPVEVGEGFGEARANESDALPD